MGNDYLKDMYNDFFGPGSGGDGKPPVFDDPSKEKEIMEKVEKDFENEKNSGDDQEIFDSGMGDGMNNEGSDPGIDIKDQERHIQDADEALREAKALFGLNAPFLRNRPENSNETNNADNSVDAGNGQNVQTMTSQGENQEQKPAEPETDPMEDLNSLIGLTDIKHDVKELTDFAKVQKMRRDGGMKAVPVSLHLVFTGNPGTGKTTVARIISRIYKQIGVLSKGQLVEVDRSGLVAGYVGQTALKTQEKINQALGGVLFIDEAYSLAQENDAFGQEAIDTILKAMEDHRDDLVVIVAGYTEPMEKFINSNPGLKSRFNKYIEFPDYSVDELEEIFNMNCKKYEYEIEEDAKKHIREMISARKLTRRDNFANAREVRNLFEEIVTNQARRIAGVEDPTTEMLKLITSEDLTEDVKPVSGRESEEVSVQGNIGNEESESGSEPEDVSVQENTGNEETESGSEFEDVSVQESTDEGDGGAK